MKKLLFLLPLSALAQNPIDGYFEVRSNVKGNRPAYIDSTGPHTQYGLDFEFRIPMPTDRLKLLIGADTFGSHSGFTRAAGRVGYVWISPWRDLELGFMHRSEHNFDYHSGPQVPYNFISDDWVFIRYNFGSTRR